MEVRLNGQTYVEYGRLPYSGNGAFAYSGGTEVYMNGTTDYIEHFITFYGGGGTPKIIGSAGNRIVARFVGA